MILLNRHGTGQVQAGLPAQELDISRINACGNETIVSSMKQEAPCVSWG